MPPRTRKTAAVKPDEQPVPAGFGAEEQAAASDADTVIEEAPAPADADVEEGPTSEPEAAFVTAPAELTYHWVSVSGNGSGPCRHCPPGGPPPGAGSYGCPHGQWVRVQDETV